MIYKAFYTAKRTVERDFDIMYRICEEKGDYYIESFICGGSFCEKAFLGRCGETKAEEFVKLGLYISIGGVSTFKNAEKIKDAARNISLEKILLETDCPYLTPHPFRGKRNDPSFIPVIAENLAKLKGAKTEDVAIITTENARRLFRI